MSEPTISVLTPVYNGERYLAEALASILGQSLASFEFVLVDDGSTDGSARILDEFACRDARIKVIRRPHQGIVATLNAGLAVARGEFIARMDADDIALPMRFQRQSDFLRAHPDYVAVGSAIEMIDSDGDPLRRVLWDERHEQINVNLLKGRGGISHPSAMLRRTCLTALGGYRRHVEFAEDMDLWLRLIEVGRLANLPDVLLKYRIHPASITQSRRTQQAQALRTAVEEACQRRGVTPPPELEATIATIERGSPPPHYWVAVAIYGGQFATARKHALRLLRTRPRAAVVWLAAGMALLGPVSRPIVRLLASCYQARNQRAYRAPARSAQAGVATRQRKRPVTSPPPAQGYSRQR